MTIDQARAEMSVRHCRGAGNVNRPCAWRTPSGRCAVGFTDGEFRYCMGVGDTWEEALKNSGQERGDE